MTRQIVPAIPKATEVAARTPGYDSATVVFLSGSLVAGFGHAYSDIDVYAGFPDEDALRHALAESDAVPDVDGDVSAFYVESQRWDVELTTVEKIERCIAQVENVADPGSVVLSIPDSDLMYRISVGKAVRGARLYRAWVDRINASVLPLVLRERYLVQADGALEDALGLLAVGDSETAAYCARAAFERMTDVFLAQTGRICPSPVWRLAQLRVRPAGPISHDEYWSITSLDGYDGRSWVERVVDRVRTLALDA